MKHIELGGKKRPVHYSINALMEFEDLTKIDITTGANLDELRKLKNIRALTFIGLKHGLKHDGGGQLDFTEEQVGDWISFNDGTADKVLEAFKNDQGADEVTEESAEEGEKKS